MSQDPIENAYQFMVSVPDEMRVEFFEKAKYPETIALTTTVPALAKNITIMKRADFEKEQKIKFCNFQIPYFVRDDFYHQNRSDFNEVAAKLTECHNHLIIGDMGKELGKGLFAKNSLNRDVNIPYGGKFIDIKTPDSGFRIIYGKRTQAVDAVKFRHLGAYAQHAPSQIPDEIDFLIPGLKETVATANAELVHFKFGNVAMPALRLLKPVEENEVICWDYGADYWPYRASPRFIDRYGRAIPRCLYRNDKISIISPSTMIISFERGMLLNVIKSDPTGNFNYFEQNQLSGGITPRCESNRVLKKSFEEKGYIPSGSYFKQVHANTINAKPIDWQREFRQAANDGRVEDMEYILDWLVPQQQIDLNASGASGKTALHFAAERGEIYAVYFLVMKDADITKKDARQKTPLDLVREQLAKQPQDRLHILQEDYEKIDKYLSDKLAKQNGYDEVAVTTVPTSSNSFARK